MVPCSKISEIKMKYKRKEATMIALNENDRQVFWILYQNVYKKN